MTLEEKSLLEILSAFLHRRKAVIPKEVKWGDLYNLAKSHAVTPILYRVIKDDLKRYEIEPQLLAKLRKSYDAGLFLAVRQEYEMDFVLKKLNQRKIPHVLMKGYHLRQYYPVREMRTMADIDILVPEDQREAAGQALERIGFVNTNKVGSTWNYQKNVLQLEVHWKLAEDMYWNSVNAEAYFEQAFAHTIDGVFPYTKYLTLEYHFIYLIFHLAKHFTLAGAGIRMFFDIAVYLERFRGTLDWKYILKEMDKLNLRAFLKKTLVLCSVWFRVPLEPIAIEAMDMPPETIEGITQYVLEGGVFGHEKRDLGTITLRRGIKRGQKNGAFWIRIKAFVKYVFPDRMYMRRYVRYVEKSHWLLPLAWMIRWGEGLTKRRNSTAIHMGQFMRNTDDAVEQDQILEYMGL